MSTLSGLGSAGSAAWSGVSASRADAMQQKMFAKVDADGSGSVDANELKTMFADISAKTGVDLGDASTALKSFDKDGNGSLDSSELAQGMKSLMPPPGSTVDFAAQRGEGGGVTQGMGPPAGEPAPDGPPPSADAGSSSSSTTSSSSTSTDPLDTNGDGVVSAQERAAGEVKEALQALLKAADSNGDGSLGSSEIGTLKRKMDAALGGSSGTDLTSPSSASQTGSNTGFDLAAFAQKVLQQYAASAAGATANALSVTA